MTRTRSSVGASTRSLSINAIKSRVLADGSASNFQPSWITCRSRTTSRMLQLPTTASVNSYSVSPYPFSARRRRMARETLIVWKSLSWSVRPTTFPSGEVATWYRAAVSPGWSVNCNNESIAKTTAESLIALPPSSDAAIPRFRNSNARRLAALFVRVKMPIVQPGLCSESRTTSSATNSL